MQRASSGEDYRMIDLYEATRFNKKKNAWVDNKAKEKQELRTEQYSIFLIFIVMKRTKIKDLKTQSQEEGGTQMTEQEICKEVLGENSDFLRGCGYNSKYKLLFNQQHDWELDEAEKRAKRAEK